MKLFFFDLETTGIRPYRNGIHQISGSVVIDGVEREVFNYLVRPNPRATIEPEALSVAGVTEAQILAYPPMEEVYAQLVALILRYIDRYDKTDKFFLVGYNNAAFDNDFLRGFFMQNGDQYFGSYFWANSLDVMVLATAALAEKRATMPNFKLSTVAQHLGIEVEAEKLHDATYDIYLTRALYDKVCGRY
ncbi:MAG: 3'-5' exonuclease [Bacteroidales bacterium]|nr:3'-5' exonuclease [Bacteroidales bacterium]